MRYRVLITEMNIDEATHPEVFRYIVDAGSDPDAEDKGLHLFSEQTGREPAPRAIIDVQPLH